MEQNVSTLITTWLYYYDAYPSYPYTVTTTNATDPDPATLEWSVPSGTLTGEKYQKTVVRVD